MEIEGIAAVSNVVPVPAAAAAGWPHPLPTSPSHSGPSHSGPSHSGLAEAEARAAETPEELAADGDPLAIAHLAAEAERLTPTTAGHLLPPHAAGAHEPGKGELIDVYD